MALDYTCDEVVDFFIRETGRFSPTMAQKRGVIGAWQAGTPRGEWVDGQGVVLNSLVFERTVPLDNGDEWTDTNPSAGDGIGFGDDQCTLNPEIVKFGQTTRSMRVQRRNIQTNDICVEDLRSDFQVAQVLGQMMVNLEYISSYVWETRYRREYIRLAEHHITERGNMDISATTFNPANPPTSRLLNGTLERIYDYLMLNGAGVDGSIGTGAGGRPIFDLYTDPNTSRDLIRQDPALREDFRFAFEGTGINSPLLQQRGDMKSYDGFRHVFDYPYRYEIVGGVERQVHPYADPTLATKGVKQDINSAYLYATYQRSVVHIPTVFRSLVPRPITNPGGKLHFDAVNYMGLFDFLVIKDKKCNPRGQKGFFDAVFASASEPGKTWHGFVIDHLNCPPLRNLLPSCYS